MRRNEQGRDHRAEKTDAGQGQPMDERGGDRGDADRAKQREGECRADKAIDAMGGVDCAEQDEGARRGQDGWYIGTGGARHGHPEPSPTHELAGGDQHKAEEPRHGQTHLGSEDTGFDGVADQEQAAQRQRYATDPHGPAGSQRSLDVGLGRCRRLCCRLHRSGRLFFRRLVLRRIDIPGPWPGNHLSAGGLGLCRVGDGRWRDVLDSGRDRFGRLALHCRAGPFGRGARKHETAQCAQLALHQSDPTLLARDDDEQGDDSDKADQTLKHHAPLGRNVLQ